MNRSYTYEYDSRGNIISKKEYAYTRITLGAAVATQNYTYNGYDRLTNTGYVYDNLGNPTSYNGKTLTWKGNSLNSFAKSGITYSLGYDWQGLLHSKTYTKNSKAIKEYYYYDGTRRTYDEIYYGNEVYPTALSYAYNKLGIAGFYLYDSQGGNTGSYTYRKNLFGDITAIYQGSTCVAKYKYDAWGNCTVCNPDGTTNASDSFIGNINPFRYRGYYWDKDLQLYYLQTRWYDPIIGRFISPDSIEYLDPESFGGLNLYAYCLNNPIMYVDPSGHVPWLIVAALLLFTPVGGVALQVASSTLSYAGMAVASIFDKDIRNDMKAIGWNPFNKDENIVAKSNKVSFYRGVPVFRTSGSSGSFICILLTKNGFKGTSGHYWSPEDILKHEWGHSIQQITYGLIPYLVNIGIPSAFIDNSDDAPWEITADLLGGVERNYNSDDIKQGWNYFSWGRLIGPFWWW